MSKATDINIKNVSVYFLPVETRMPLKFGPETLTHVTCARICFTVENMRGKVSTGWGETPLSVQWAWPSSLTYQERNKAMQDFCIEIAKSWLRFTESGHPMELGHRFLTDQLPTILSDFNRNRSEPMPWLSALVCSSAFDIALHDAYGNVNDVYIYDTYNSTYMNGDLSCFISPEEETKVSFSGKYPEDYLIFPRKERLIAWHLVGGKDPLSEEDLDGSEPNDGYPVLLPDWIVRDGLKCLKVKLRGNDSGWDYDRLVKVGKIAIEHDVNWLTSDFNCTVTEPDYVNDILDRLMLEHPRIYGMILYVEQPFPYDLESNQIDVHSVSARKPLFMDESAHDWRMVRLGRRLGWTGVALKTCKTQTNAILTLCWAKAHGMTLMVQDLTNPMLAQITHVLLASHAGTIMGVEVNSMQFYPDASIPEAKVHPGIYRRRDGVIDLSTIRGNGFGYQIEAIERRLPNPAFEG